MYNPWVILKKISEKDCGISSYTLLSIYNVNVNKVSKSAGGICVMGFVD